MKQTIVSEFVSKLTSEEKPIFYSLIGYPKSFSVDWFPDLPHSIIYDILQLLLKRHWIKPLPERRGHYSWSSNFPYEEAIALLPAEELSSYYRLSADRLLKLLPNEEITLTLAQQYILAGLREEDLDIIASAGYLEEKQNRLSSASYYYDAILIFVEQLLITGKLLSETTWNTFILAVEHRASLSFFHPSLQDLRRFLDLALENTIKRKDLKNQAHLEMLIGQNHWLSLQHQQALEHFNRAWEIINQVNDPELLRKGLKVRGLVYGMKGDFTKAVECYEEALGDLETYENSDFFLVAALSLAVCYTEIGMPQRGIGISESIQNFCRKNENLPLLAFAHTTAGMILLQMRNLEESRANFEIALEIAQKANLTIIEVLASKGLANVCCHEGDYDRAFHFYQPILKIDPSNWVSLLVFFPLVEGYFILCSKGLIIKNQAYEYSFDFFRKLKIDEVNPLVYSMTNRFLTLSPESTVSSSQKIQTLLSLEEIATKAGANFEASLIRIELARLYMQQSDTQRAQDYASKAWNFLKSVAPKRFPHDLFQLLPKDGARTSNVIHDLCLEMSEAVFNQESHEQLAANIISAITRVSGAEKEALFIKDKRTSELRMIASRNIFPEDLTDENFGESMALIRAAAHGNSREILRYELPVGSGNEKKRIIISPLKSLNRIVGVLYKEGRSLNLDIIDQADNAEYIPILSSQVALALDCVLSNYEIEQLNKKLLSENMYYNETMDELRPFRDIVGTSKAITKVQALIWKVAPTQSTVLIHGETGVGKELVARAIHRESARKEGPFIRVNCAALPDTLIDSELFGHEKGAFTGATHTKAGRFELANNGTIFLDEISELPPSTQSRLLRILQEKEFQRVGGTKILHSNFRLIAATNKNLGDEVANGKFRSDLFYRLNVFPIHVPPLRERKEDIPHLATHFLKLYSKQNSKKFIGISNSEMEKLKAHSWPGNIRELSNVIELAAIMGETKISFPDLKEQSNIKVDNDLNLKENEKALILDALEKSGGKVSGQDGAAALLGLHRSTLLHRMKKHGIKAVRLYEQEPSKLREMQY